MAGLEGMTALVTGGSRGIGLACARALQQLGADVVIAGAHEDRVVRAKLDLQVEGIVCDLTQPESVAAMMLELERLAPQGVDILVNNAGLTRDGLFVRMKNADWDAVMDVNVRTAMELSRALLPAMMKKRWGRIINMASVVAFSGNTGQAAYVASKAALVGLTRALAVEVAKKGVTVNAVAPGFIDTDMTAELTENVREQMLAAIPAGRFGSPADVAAAVAFLASHAAAYVNGTTLHVNGGMFVG